MPKTIISHLVGAGGWVRRRKAISQQSTLRDAACPLEGEARERTRAVAADISERQSSEKQLIREMRQKKCDADAAKSAINIDLANSLGLSIEKLDCRLGGIARRHHRSISRANLDDAQAEAILQRSELLIYRPAKQAS